MQYGSVNLNGGCKGDSRGCYTTGGPGKGSKIISYDIKESLKIAGFLQAYVYISLSSDLRAGGYVRLSNVGHGLLGPG